MEGMNEWEPTYYINWSSEYDFFSSFFFTKKQYINGWVDVQNKKKQQQFLYDYTYK